MHEQGYHFSNPARNRILELASHDLGELFIPDSRGLWERNKYSHSVTTRKKRKRIENRMRGIVSDLPREVVRGYLRSLPRRGGMINGDAVHWINVRRSVRHFIRDREFRSTGGGER